MSNTKRSSVVSVRNEPSNKAEAGVSPSSAGATRDTRPGSPFTVRDTVGSWAYSVSGRSPVVRDAAISQALGLREWYRGMATGSIPPVADLAEAASPNLDRWVSRCPSRTNAEVLSGFSMCDSSGLYDFAASIWTERDIDAAASELGLSAPVIDCVRKNSLRDRFAFLDFVCSGPVWGQGYGTPLVDRACAEARIARFASIFTKAPTPQLVEWFSRKAFTVIGQKSANEPAVMMKILRG